MSLKVLFVQVPRPLCAHLLSRCHLINSKLEGKPRMYKDSISLRLRLDLLLCVSPTQCPLTLWRRKTQIIKSSFRNAKGVNQPVGSNKLTMFYICQVPHPCHRPPCLVLWILVNNEAQINGIFEQVDSWPLYGSRLAWVRKCRGNFHRKQQKHFSQGYCLCVSGETSGVVYCYGDLVPRCCF